MRAKAHADFVYFKRRMGSGVVALRASILEESQRHWLKSAKEVAEVRTKRTNSAYSGIPNTKTGVCCTAKDFKGSIAAYDKTKSEKIKLADEKRRNKATAKRTKEVQQEVNKEIKKAAQKGGEGKKNAAPQPPGAPKKKRKKRDWDDGHVVTEADEDGIEISLPSDDEFFFVR